MQQLDVNAIRADFPILSRTVNGNPLVYLDSANTSQKPTQVIEAVEQQLGNHNANVARAMHTLGAEATLAFEDARQKVADFIGAASADEIVFTKNASEALNLAASSLTKDLGPGDEVVISVMEHHSNLVSWQLACRLVGAKLRWFDITDDGFLDLEKAEAENLINERTKVVSLTWVSNVLGTVNPVEEIAKKAHEVGAIMVVDGSQAVPQRPTDVKKMGIDLLAFTGHKMLAPTGIGVLWGRYELLEKMPPFLGGGEMIQKVRMDGSTYMPPPHRFEAGTPPIAEAVGLGAAVDYLNCVGMEKVAAHEHEITSLMLTMLTEVDGVHVMGPTDPSIDRGAAVAFTVDGVHPHDVMQLLDSRGVAVRGGHHCAEPLHHRLGIQSSSRASAYLYTKPEEIDAFIDALVYTRDFFTRRKR